MSRFISAIANIIKSVRRALLRDGVNIGGTASYPRVEIHNIVEDTPMTKDLSLRQITATIECVSAEKVADIVQLTEDNIELLFADDALALDGFDVVGIMPGQIRMFEEQESSDSATVIYRMLQDVTITVEKHTEESEQIEQTENNRISCQNNLETSIRRTSKLKLPTPGLAASSRTA